MSNKNPMQSMLLQIFFGSLKVWIKEDPEKAIVELDKAIAALKDS